jgi:hypothetical protein
MALPPLTLEQWNGYCLRYVLLASPNSHKCKNALLDISFHAFLYLSSVVNILFALVGILMSLSVIFSCQFFSVPVDPESLSSVVGGNNVDSSYEVSVGLFRHTLTKDDYSLDSASECRMYDDSFLLDPDSAFYDSSLAAAQIGALLAPVLALLGCIFCFLHVFCRIFYVVGFWLTSGSWFVATILQAMSFLAFQHEKFWYVGKKNPARFAGPMVLLDALSHQPSIHPFIHPSSTYLIIATVESFLKMDVKWTREPVFRL